MSKYRSLADVYGDNAFKSVPKLQRQRVIGEDLETKIYFRDLDDDEPVSDDHAVGTLTKDKADLLRRRIINQSSGIYDIINEMLLKAGFSKALKKGGKQVVPKDLLLNVVATIEQNTDVNLEGLEAVNLHKKQLTNLGDAIKQSAKSLQPFNLIDVLQDEAEAAFVKNADGTLKELCQLSGQLGVNIGKCEIAIGMFTDGVKPEAGDIRLSIGDVEIKGKGGRPAKSGNIMATINKVIPDLLKSKTGSNIKRQSFLKRLNINYIGKRKRILERIDDLLERGFRKPYPDNVKEVLSGIKENILKLNDQIDSKIPYDVKNIDDIKNDLNNTLGANKLPKDFFKELNEFHHTYEIYRENLLDEDENLLKNNKIDYSPDTLKKLKDKSGNPKKYDYYRKAYSEDMIVNLFNSSNKNISIDDKIDVLMKLSDSDKVNRDSFREAISSVLNNNFVQAMMEKDSITDDVGKESYVASQNAKNLIGTFVSALQISIYQQQEGFEYILLINDEGKKATYTSVVIDFPFNDEKKSFVNTFNKLKNYIDKGIIKIDLNSLDEFSQSAAALSILVTQ